MAKLHDDKYKKWDKIAKDLVTTTAAEDEADKEASSVALGHKTQNWSKDEEKEKAKRAQARKAKVALDLQRELEEAQKFELNMSLIPESNLGDADEGKVPTPFNVTDAVLGGKKLLTLSGLKHCHIVLEGPSTDPLIKVFVLNCTHLTISLSRRLLTSHVEVSHSHNLTLDVVSSRLSTLQLDLCNDVSVTYGPGTFDGDDDRVYHAGVKGLTVRAVVPDGTTGGLTVKEIKADYEGDGARAIHEARKEEYQFATMLVDGNELKTEHLVRVGNKFLTGKQWKEVDDNTTVDGGGGDDEKDAKTKASDLALALSKYKEAALHKEEGNDAFKNGEYGQAILFYSMAVDKAEGALPDLPPPPPPPPKEENAVGGDDQQPQQQQQQQQGDVDRTLVYVSLANRSFCFLKLGHHEKALEDAEKCLAVNPSYAKGLFRKGMALHAMGRWEEALPVLGRTLQMEPKNEQVKTAIKFAEVKLQQDLRKRMQGSER